MWGGECNKDEVGTLLYRWEHYMARGLLYTVIPVYNEPGYNELHTFLSL
jgi:hypothetical protein